MHRFHSHDKYSEMWSLTPDAFLLLSLHCFSGFFVGTDSTFLFYSSLAFILETKSRIFLFLPEAAILNCLIKNMKATQTSELRSRKSEVGSRKLEVGSRKCPSSAKVERVVCQSNAISLVRGNGLVSFAIAVTDERY